LDNVFCGVLLSRWFAAFLVVISHLRNLLFADYEFIENKNILIQSFYFFTGFGHLAVIIFFVLSGFLIGGSVLSRIKLENFSLTRYCIDRFSRIYMVFPFTLLIGFLLDWLGYFYFNSTGIYTNKFNFATAGFNIYERLQPEIFLSNFFMLQTIASPTLGSNGPLWSLANEWWYYFCFPLMILSFTHKNFYKRLICLIVFFSLSIMMYNSNEHGNMLFSFSIWIIGSLLWIKPKKINFKTNFYFASLLMIIYACFLRINNSNFFFQNLIFSVLFALMLNSINKSNKLIKNMEKINKLMASFSYSLYLVHMPLIIFIIAVLSHLHIIGVQMQPIPSTFLVFLLVLIITYIFSFYFGAITENNTPHFKKILYHSLNFSVTDKL
jgi:peptidoglycan/LPS O-acetylase OafA/YrhL